MFFNESGLIGRRISASDRFAQRDQAWLHIIFSQVVKKQLDPFQNSVRGQLTT